MKGGKKMNSLAKMVVILCVILFAISICCFYISRRTFKKTQPLYLITAITAIIVIIICLIEPNLLIVSMVIFGLAIMIQGNLLWNSKNGKNHQEVLTELLKSFKPTSK